MEDSKSLALSETKLIRGLAKGLIAELESKYDLTQSDAARELRGYLSLFRQAELYLTGSDRERIQRLINQMHLVPRD